MICILADVRTDCTCPAKPEARVLIGVGSRRRQARYWIEFATMKWVLHRRLFKRVWMGEVLVYHHQVDVA
jgi:hypothetical protein